MKLYVLKYKNYYLHYGFNEALEEEYLIRESSLGHATFFDELEDIKCILKDLKENNIKLFVSEKEQKEIKEKTYILEIEIKEIGEINNG